MKLTWFVTIFLKALMSHSDAVLASVCAASSPPSLAESLAHVLPRSCGSRTAVRHLVTNTGGRHALQTLPSICLGNVYNLYYKCGGYDKSIPEGSDRMH